MHRVALPFACLLVAACSLPGSGYRAPAPSSEGWLPRST